MKYRSIFISDVHLGTRDSQARGLLKLIRENEADNLFLVGDIIDGWALKRKWIWPQSHSDVIQKILRLARKGTQIHYILGNHDEFIQGFLPITMGDNIHISSEHRYIDLQGRELWVVHGDLFDSITMNQKWLALLGDRAYLFLLKLNHPITAIRRMIGYRQHWSLSKYMKESVKKSVSFVTNYEEILSAQARQEGYDGVICGHIHKAEIRDINGIRYLNCGDWVESCTALVETTGGEWHLLEYLNHDD